MPFTRAPLPRKNKLLLTVTLCAIFALASCGSGGSSSSTTTPPPPQPTAEKASHVVLLVLENKNFNEVVGNPNAPFFNSLIAKGTLAKNYFANKHPSMGDYLMMTTGEIASTLDTFSGPVASPNIVSALAGAGKNWKVYAEGIPSIGYTGPNTGLYLQRHNPLALFSNVAGTPAANNIVPFTQFATDVTGTLPAFTMIVGNIFDTGHDCVTTVNCADINVKVQQEVKQQDAFLQNTVPQILANAGFSGGDSAMLIIAFDESDNDNLDGPPPAGTQAGGQVATLLLGTNVKVGGQAVALYHHESLLRLMLESQGISSTLFPFASATAPSMAAEVFN